ncbi:MAG: ribonuclease Y [Thermodesulfobacteriota bacterium]
MESAVFYVIGIVIFVVGASLGFVVRKVLFAAGLDAEKKKVEDIISNAKREAENIRREAEIQTKDRLYQSKIDFERGTKARRRELQNLEKRLLNKENSLDNKSELLDRKEMEYIKKAKELTNKEREVLEKVSRYDQLIREGRDRLERIAEISVEEAKKLLIDLMREEAKHDAAKMIKRIGEEAEETAAKKAQEIIALSVQRYSGDYAVERTVTIVNLPNDEMKGRIIGREGRNIRALEAATGIDLIIDDTPQAVILSSMNPVRREVAKVSLDRLISDGRIHPARIEEVVAKVEQEINTTIKEAGEQAVFDVGIHGLHPELLKLIGRLKFRTSYAQNVYVHSLEVAFLCGIMAGEIGLNEKQAKRAGLLHDIGKAVDHEVEGSHAVIGSDIARRYGETAKIITAIGGHHDDKPGNVLGVLVQAADTLSAARPGARKEMLESYVKRIEDLECIASSFTGVEKSYAIQAGREVRVIVESNKISDEATFLLSKEITKKIEKELTYPGQVKVTVIRETRAVDYAK